MELTKKQILENRQILNEDAWENALMVAGFIPVVGEIADWILIMKYVREKQYLYAGLMLIALIPTVGDFIAKPFIKLLKTAGIGGRTALAGTKEMTEYLAKNPQLKSQFVKVAEHASNPKLVGTINKIEKIPGVGGIAGGLRKSLSSISETAVKLTPVKAAVKVGKDVGSGAKLSTSLKSFFKDRALSKYVEKKGMEPSNWLSKWWNVTRVGRKDRRNTVKQFIIANGILDLFGLPSFDAFENKFETDANFREQLANDPKFSAIVNRTTTPEDLASIEGGSTGESGGGLLGGTMGLGVIKMLAKMV